MANDRSWQEVMAEAEAGNRAIEAQALAEEIKREAASSLPEADKRLRILQALARQVAKSYPAHERPMVLQLVAAVMDITITHAESQSPFWPVIP